jgi:hypothetical protein
MTEPVEHPKFLDCLERQFVRSPAAAKLQAAITKAVRSYITFLNRDSGGDLISSDELEQRATDFLVRWNFYNGEIIATVAAAHIAR